MFHRPFGRYMLTACRLLLGGLVVASAPAQNLPVRGWSHLRPPQCVSDRQGTRACTAMTTAQQQVLPVKLSADTPPIRPSDVPLYEYYGYSAWQTGSGTNYSQDPDSPQAYDKRTELAPAYKGASNEARLLSFFSVSDVHITDKESPAQAIYIGWSAEFGPSSYGKSSCYSPVILSTTHVLDAAIQTINSLHQISKFDFGIALGDAINNAQYNELRWYIDVFDGKVITPSSGADIGADRIDYQKPYKAAGIDKAIPWYQVIGNHDQFWAGAAAENAKTLQAHVGNTILDMGTAFTATPPINETGAYMGVVDGSSPYGRVIGAGPEENFSTPPAVVADTRRRSLSTSESSSRNWMTEFFETLSNPVGHGFTQANLDSDLASYTFEPKADLPLKVIVLDDTCKASDTASGGYYARACLDQARLDWLKRELEKGQSEGKLMIIAAHIPIRPQAGFTDITSLHLFSDPAQEDSLLAPNGLLHSYPNLILWISGHIHRNTVTPQPANPSDLNDHPENSFWEVETASLRDFPQQFRTFDIRRNRDNTISILITNVDPAVRPGTPAAKSRGYAVGAARIFGATPATLADTTSHAYNAELVKQLTPEMQAKIAGYGSPLETAAQ